MSFSDLVWAGHVQSHVDRGDSGRAVLPSFKNSQLCLWVHRRHRGPGQLVLQLTVAPCHTLLLPRTRGLPPGEEGRQRKTNRIKDPSLLRIPLQFSSKPPGGSKQEVHPAPSPPFKPVSGADQGGQEWGASRLRTTQRHSVYLHSPGATRNQATRKVWPSPTPP